MHSLVHLLCPALLIFVVGGWDAFRNPAGKAKRAEAVTHPLAEKAGVEWPRYRDIRAH